MKRGQIQRTEFKRKPEHKGFKRPASRKALGTKKPKEGSKRALEKKLESLNAQYVKLRDGHECVQCRADGIPTTGILDAGHLYPKSVFRATKYRCEAIYAQCRRHNLLHCRQPAYFLTWFEDTYGHDRLDEIHMLAVSDWRPTIEWLESEIALREQQISELRTHYEAQT